MMQLMDAYKANGRAAGGSREQFLEMAAAIPGLYVPAFYDVAYNEDGTIASFWTESFMCACNYRTNQTSS